MLNIAKETRLKPQDVIQRAVAFFGPKGYGLELKEVDNCNAYLVGGGGHVRVAAANSKKGSSVDIEAVEWDFQAQEFLDKLK